MNTSARLTNQQTLDSLRRQIRAIENEPETQNARLVSNGFSVIDDLLPSNGYPRGSLIDWIAPTGCATDYLSLKVAQKAAADGGAIVVIDPHRQFFPIAAAAMGINPQQLIVLQSSVELPAGGIDQDLLWAIDQSLCCSAVAAVWGPLPPVDDRWARRFQLSAKSSGCMGLFVRPLSVARQPSWSQTQWLVSPASPSRMAENADQNVFFTRLQMIRNRSSHTGQSVLLSINSVTGDVVKARYPYGKRSNSSNAASTPRHHRAAFLSGERVNVTQTSSLPVASRVAHPTINRRLA